MKALIVMVVAAVAIVVSYHYHWLIPGCIAGAVFLFAFAEAMKANSRAESAASVRIMETHEALRSSVVETHLLVVSKLFGYPDLAKQAIEILIDAASYLSGPPSSRAVITSDYVLDWNKRGLARVAEAKALIDEHLKAHPFSGGLGDTIR
jgi:hypothetical protein